MIVEDSELNDIKIEVSSLLNQVNGSKLKSASIATSVPSCAVRDLEMVYPSALRDLLISIGRDVQAINQIDSDLEERVDYLLICFRGGHEMNDSSNANSSNSLLVFSLSNLNALLDPQVIKKENKMMEENQNESQNPDLSGKINLIYFSSFLI